jgi:hypothetical protein
MLQTLASEIRECYRHAAECNRSAHQSRDSLTKQDFLDMERRWLDLAHSYEFAQRLSNFSEPSRRRNRQKIQEAAFAGSISSHSNQWELAEHGPAEKGV